MANIDKEQNKRENKNVRKLIGLIPVLKDLVNVRQHFILESSGVREF